MADNKPPDSKESKLIRAAGAVAWRPGPDGGEPEVLLVHRKKYDDWSLPKGKAEPGEPLPVTAVREVFEEGGARLVLGRRLVSVRYQAGGRPKRVHYWAASVAGIDEKAVPNHEVDQVAWLSLGQAWERASYGHDVRVLEDFARLPAGTVPLILLRHATALPRSGWTGDDASRPLDDSGRADAKALAGLLSCFAPRAHVVSSPAVRCLETVRPYAGLAGAGVRAERALRIPSSETEAAGSAPLIAGAVRAGGPAVFCVHRENLPALRAAAVEALGMPAGSALPDDWGDPLPTSGFWVLHVAPSPRRMTRRRWFGRRAGADGAAGTLLAADRYDLSELLTDS